MSGSSCGGPSADPFLALRADCARCSGLCCVALYCVKTDGFPANKEAGVPCRHLAPDARCEIHPQLAQRGLRGCLAYDCFGAGQLVTRRFALTGGWRAGPGAADAVFGTFHRVYQLHQMQWYLTQAYIISPGPELQVELQALCAELEQTAQLPLDALSHTDLEALRSRVNGVLRRTITALGAAAPEGGAPRDWVGKDLRRARLAGGDLSMALLIGADLRGCDLRGANLLGADLRGADLRGADLSTCLFLTQMQLASARGDDRTKLPGYLSRPAGWT